MPSDVHSTQIAKHMNLKLKEKVILVSGGARGIGQAIVHQLALEGAYPVIIDREAEESQRTLDVLQAAGGFGISIAVDLQDPLAANEVISKTVQTFGRIDGLVNNAGINDLVGLQENGGYQSFMDSLHRNVIHYYLLAHEAIGYLKQTKGVILNILSKVAETGQGRTSGYAAANGARFALTREWATELAQDGIRVNGLVVADCLTPMYEEWLKGNPQLDRQKIENRIPLGHRFTTPEEIAQTAVFLLSSKASHITGEFLHVDGGYVHLDRALSAPKL